MWVLNVEDDARDSLLIERALRLRFGAVELTRVETPEEFKAALEEHPWDIVIADHKLPRFSPMGAVTALKASGRDIPLIVVSGAMGLDFAVEAMRAGARDYLVKSDLVRLGAVVERELQDASARRLTAARHVLIGEVLDALNAPGELAPQLRAVLEKLCVHAGADAAGIRLRTRDDFPYVAQVGFDAAFLVSEKSFSLVDEGVLIQLPLLERRCAEAGYRSVALLPLRAGQEVVGLLHLTARAPGRFGADLIKFMEEIAPSLAPAVERRRLEARLAQSDRMASVGMLAAGVAHEVNNPLTYVLNNLEALVADLPALEAAAPRAREQLDLVRLAEDALVGVRRIRAIVQDLKVFSRAGSDRPEPVAPNKVINGAINLAFNEIRYRARLDTDLGNLPQVLANEGRLAQLFLNLLVNAAQAIPEGDVDQNRITVKTWAEQGAVFVEVRDTGSGMTEEIQERIFDPFFTTKPEGVGSGLGLAISREIVEAVGGQITVESAPGKGSRFLVRLPAVVDGQAPGASFPPAAPVQTAPVRRGRLLVIDDEPLVRASMVRILRAEHDVVEASSGYAAASLLGADDSFDVILCDLVMPELSGMDLHARLASARPDLAARMVFVTGGAFTARAVEFLNVVPNLRVDKPFDSIGLRELIRKLVRARASPVHGDWPPAARRP